VAVKEALARAAHLSFPVEGAQLVLATDASATAVGAVLQQRTAPHQPWQPLGFFSAKLEKAQLVYSAFDRELFGIYAAIKHFRYQLEGRNFAVWTDHKPLIYALKQPGGEKSARQQRQLSYIAEYTSQLIHVPGKENVVACSSL